MSGNGETREGAPPPLAHEGLEVYAVARELQRVVKRTLDRVPRGRGHADSVEDVRRAAKSVTHNITEGADEFSPGDKAKFYRYARRPSSEVAGGLDSLVDWGGLQERDTWPAKWLIHRINSMLTGMIRSQAARSRH